MVPWCISYYTSHISWCKPIKYIFFLWHLIHVEYRNFLTEIFSQIFYTAAAATTRQVYTIFLITTNNIIHVGTYMYSVRWRCFIIYYNYMCCRQIGIPSDDVTIKTENNSTLWCAVTCTVSGFSDVYIILLSTYI